MEVEVGEEGEVKEQGVVEVEEKQQKQPVSYFSAGAEAGAGREEQPGHSGQLSSQRSGRHKRRQQPWPRLQVNVSG